MCSNPDFCLFLSNEQSCHTDPRSWEMTLPWCWQLSSDGTWTLLLLPEVVCYPPGPEGVWFGESYSLFSCLIALLAKTSYALFGQPLVGVSSKGRDFFSIFRILPVWVLIPAPWFMSLLIGLMKAGEKLSFLWIPQMEVSEGTQWPHRGCISPPFSWNGGVVDFKPILIKHLLHTMHGGRNHANVISLSPYHLSETEGNVSQKRKVRLRRDQEAHWSQTGLLVVESGFEPRSVDSHVWLFPYTPWASSLLPGPLSAKEKTFAMFCVLEGKPKEFPTIHCWHFKYCFMGFLVRMHPGAYHP